MSAAGARPLHVGFLPPCYGVEVVGGAEHGARMIAEHLVAAGWRASVWTSRARSAATWAPEYPAGDEVIGGVEVHRRDGTGRAPDFPARCDALLGDPAAAPAGAVEAWIDAQGPVVPAALDEAEASDADIIVGYPYLYWTVVHGVRRMGTRTVLQAAAHDEPPIRLPAYRDVFTRTGGLVHHSDAERRLVGRLFPATVTMPQATIGLGVDAGEGDPAAAAAALGVPDRPYVLCLGRVNELKGTTMLARWWAEYKRRHPGPTALVLAGPVTDQPPAHPDVVVAGPVDEEVKWGALQGALALVTPSFHESFSLVLLEAWSVGCPALVNAACGPTAEHSRRSGGGVAVGGYAGFEAAMRRLETDPAARRAMGAAGRAYVEARYSWAVVTRRYQAFYAAAAERHRAGAGPRR